MDASPSSAHLGALRPGDLPTPRPAALAVLRASAADTDSRSLAALVSRDPAFAAELLRIANSPFYGLGREVRSTAQAVTLLGHKTLRNLVLSLSVRDALSDHAIAGFDVEAYWEDVLRCAAAARLLGEARGLDGDECFTAGLLQDFGLLAMFHVMPEHGAAWGQLRTMDPAARLQAERARFGITHDQVALMLARSWALPDSLARALACHHRCPDASLDEAAAQLCVVLHGADWMASVYSAADTGAVLGECRRILASHLGLGGDAADGLLGQLPELVDQAAAALGLRLQRQVDFDAVLRQANLRLAEENLSYQELTWRLGKALRERDRLAAERDRELELAGEIQRSLLPADLPEGFPVAAVNLPARSLSGDFYDYFQLPDGRIYFNLADVSGKGITAALLMAKASSLFHCLGRQLPGPAPLLGAVNRELCETSTHGMFVTMIAGLYDPRSARVQLVNAGHPPALRIANDGGVTRFGAGAPPLGVLAEAAFAEVTVDLAQAALYLFSDGVIEAALSDGTALEVDGLARVLAGMGARSLRDRLDAVVRLVRTAGRSQRDDITMMVVQGP